MLKNEKSATRDDHQNRKTEVFCNKNRKTDLKNSQNRKTENPNAPLRMSWVSLSMKSRYNALWFILAHHICTFNYLCRF